MSKLFANSHSRHNGGARIKRLHGSSTVTAFHVGVVGSDPSTWESIEGYGPTPGDRKTYALEQYRKRHPEAAAPAPKVPPLPNPRSAEARTLSMFEGVKPPPAPPPTRKMNTGRVDPHSLDLFAPSQGDLFVQQRAKARREAEQAKPKRRRAPGSRVKLAKVRKVTRTKAGDEVRLVTHAARRNRFAPKGDGARYCPICRGPHKHKHGRK